MALAPDELEEQLRLAQQALWQLGRDVSDEKRWHERWDSVLEDLRQWKHDTIRDRAKEQAGLTRREKWIGAALVMLGPLVTALAQHYLR